MHRVLLILFVLLHDEFIVVLTLEPTVTAIVAGYVVVGGFAGVKLHCKINECCDDAWITADISGELLFSANVWA